MKPVAVFCGFLLAACATAPRQTAPMPPPAAAPPARSPNALTPLAAVSRTIKPPLIRVGLLTDQSTIVFPRTTDGYYVVADAGPSMIRRGFTVTAPSAEALVRYALQASAISDSNSATAFAEKVRGETGLRVDSVFDTASGAYKILVGDFASEAEAQPTRDRLIRQGYAKEMMTVRRPSDRPFEMKHLIVDDEGDRVAMEGQTLLILPVSADTITIGEGPYRTAARLFINTRGLYNVINELNLEDYLRGVVPAEMGPTIFDEVEALKAQAIAARTYAVRNLGQFRSEGYDICPGPACQAYKGFAGEHPLSNRAVEESAGLIITFEGKPIDALYTATCGGETSDVSTMFPSRSEPYLRRAKCVELEMIDLAGRADSGLLTEEQTNGRIFAALAKLTDSGSWSARDVDAAVRAALRFLGAPEPAAATRPASSRRGDVLRYLATVLRLDEHARALTLPEDRTYFFPESRKPEEVVYAAAAFLIKYGLVPAQDIDRIDLDVAMPRDELYALLWSVLREFKSTSEVTGKIAALSGRELALKAEGKTTRYTLPDGVPLFRRLGDRIQEYKTLPIMLGDRAIVHLDPRSLPIAMIVTANYDGASFDRTSSFANWTRSYRAEELIPSINKRQPIQQLVDIRPLVVDASKRIAELEVTAEGGRTFVLRGLPVRWSLNVPDNLFTYQKTKDPDGMDRYTFFGKGWGHGTGMCQVGAYGMAFRGWSAERILKNFYAGVAIEPLAVNR